MLNRYSRHLMVFAIIGCLAGLGGSAFTQAGDKRIQRTMSVPGIRGQAIKTGYVVLSEVAKLSQAHPSAKHRNKPWMPIPSWFQKAKNRAGGNQSANSVRGKSANANNAGLLSVGPPAGGPLGVLANFIGCPDIYRYIPPDTMGAVGLTRIVSTTNDLLRVQTRNGNVIQTINPIENLWVNGGIANANEFFSDPKVIYDPSANRFILTEATFDTGTESLLIAVSINGDPSGGWKMWRVKADPNSQLLADYPSVGFNGKWYVVCENMYDNVAQSFSHVRIYMFDKADLYNPAGTAAHTMLDDPDGGFNMAPAPIYDNTPDMYFIDDWDPFSGTLRFSTVTGAVGSEVLNTGVTFPVLSKTWDFQNEAPQKGTSGTIPTGDIWRPMTLAYRNGKIWGVFNVGAVDGVVQFRSCAQIFQLDNAGNLLQDSRIDDPGSADPNYYYYPSIAVNQNGDVCVGMTRSSSTEFASAYYAFHFAADPPGSIRPEALYKAGTAPYDWGGGAFRWGDYSATVVDPDQNTFWTIQQIAVTPSTPFPTFATWWAHLLPVVPAVTLFLNPTSVNAGDSSTGTVTLGTVAVSDKVINLSSSNTNVATVDQPSITIPAGQNTGTFTISTNPNSPGQQTADITASDGVNSDTATLTVTAFLDSIEFNPDGQDIFWVPAASLKGGGIIKARVNLSNPAPEGGIVVQLASEDPNVATVTSSVTVQGGRISQTFYVFTVPVPATTTVLVSASARASTVYAPLTVEAPVPTSLSIIPTTVVGGNNASGVVYVDSPAPSSGLPIALTSSKPQYASVPATVTIPASKTYVSFTIKTSTVTSNQTSQISASNEGVTVKATINVAPVAGTSLTSLVFNPSTVPGGTALKGTITLTRPAPVGGVTIALTKTDPGGGVILPIPATVFIPAGVQIMTFILQTNVVAADANATITATYNTASKSAAVKVRAPYLTSVTILPTSIRVNTSATGRVFLSGPALSAVTVTLAHSAGVTCPANVVVPKGATSATFTVTATATGTQTVTGTYPVGTSVTAQLLVLP